MKNSEIIKIWKEIIYIAWYYKNYTDSDKLKIEKKLLFYKKELEFSENIYSKRLLDFINDLLFDLKNWRRLTIDTIFDDDFVWNYYYSSKQVKIYNSLIDQESYKNIILNKDYSKNNIYFENFYENYKKNFLKLDFKEISYLLLIFTNFNLISPKKYLKRLFDFRKKYWFSFKNIKKLEEIIFSYEKFLDNIYKSWLKNLKNKNIAYKYIKIIKDWEEKNFELNFHLRDSSFENFRTWNVIYEYKEVLKNLKKNS